MKVLQIGVFAAALGATGTVAGAQAPVAVPIVGSPAAQQPPSQPPAPNIPSQPPSVPSQPPMAPASPAPSMPGAQPDAAARPVRKLDLTVKDGTIALDAQGVTLRDIMTEWQKRSGCQFVNSDKLPASQVTIQFPAGTPERIAIDSLLHGLGTATTGYGYMIAAKSVTDPTCGAVYILATSRPSAAPASYSPTGGAPIAAPLVTGGSPDDEIPPVTPFPPNIPPQPRPAPGQVPNPNGIPGQPNQNPAGSAPAGAQPGGFGPIAPSAPGAGRIGGPPATPPNGGRGGGPGTR